MTPPEELPLLELARQKLARIFGERRAEQLLAETMKQAGVEALATPADLLRVGRVLEERGGFEAAVGAILTMQATLRSVDTG